MRDQGKLLSGIVIGVGLAYLLDPDRGARRRALLRDQTTRAGHRLAQGLDATARDLRNRAGGTAAEVRSRFRHDDADDTVLHERIRSAIGRVVSHPGAVLVDVQDGRVTLRGHVLEEEAAALRRTVRSVRGVSDVTDELSLHPDAENIPSLQGEGRAGAGGDRWGLGTRLAVGSIGAGLLARALEIPAVRRMAAGRSDQRTYDVQKAITVRAPIEEVWELWSNYENFPRFMRHLEEVRRTGERQSHWVARGPAGSTVAWDAVTTAWEPNERIAWRSVEGSSVENAGEVRFRSIGNDMTQVDVRMSYNPPGGAAGHAVAALFGSDPRRAMDEDMVRLKSLLEDGKTTADEGPVERDEVTGPGAREVW
ncbi:MAG TPA: SRPBCC family protein [Gemmatimonadales bacterium]|nr:SRPBCC family protein [Gemmatimonadales bacterium]